MGWADNTDSVFIGDLQLKETGMVQVGGPYKRRSLRMNTRLV